MRRSLFTISAIVIALVLSGCGGHEAPTGREGDIYFAQMMIPHHQQALEMSEIALYAALSELRVLAEPYGIETVPILGSPAAVIQKERPAGALTSCERMIWMPRGSP